MSKKKSVKPEDIRWCQNEMGGLGISPCQGASELATVKFRVDPAFSGMDDWTIFLCDDCAERLKAHAEGLGYEAEIE